MAAPKQSSPNQPVQQASSQGATAEPTAVAVAAADDASASLPVKPPPQAVAEADEQPPVAIKTAAEKAEAGTESFPKAAPLPTYAATEASEMYQTAKQYLVDGEFEAALEIIEHGISTTLSLLPDDDEGGDNDLHESLAPLYYLYGTTLLYYVEETENDPNKNVMVDNPNNGAPITEESAGDLQVAWENLESARHIVQALVLEQQTSSEKLKLDLAQIRLRLGDLERTNGRYMDAVADYMACLELRQPILGPYDRKVADTQYQLGLVCMMLASEGDKQQEQQQQQHQLTGQQAAPMSPDLIEEYRTKSIQHYMACSRSLAGNAALLCDADPIAITADAVPEGGGKTTGLDPSDLLFHSSSRTLRAIRDRVASLNSQSDNVAQLADMLEEIQEIIDEAENTKHGLHDVSKMSAKIHAEIAAADNKAEGGATTTIGFGDAAAGGGATTTIGFGDAAAAAGGATTAVGFGDAAATATAAASAPMLVKKKKKRDAEDSKIAAVASEDAKRSKKECLAYQK